MTSEELLKLKINELNFPYYLYIQLLNIDSEDHTISITIWRFPTSIAIKTHHISNYAINNSYEFDSAEKVIKQIQFILAEYNSKISSVFELQSKREDLFSVDVFNDQNRLAYNFTVIGTNNTKERLVNTVYYIRDLNCSELIRDFKIVLEILKDQNIRCRIGGNNPFTYVRRMKIQSLKSVILNA